MKNSPFVSLFAWVLIAHSSFASEWVRTGRMSSPQAGTGLVTLNDGRALATASTTPLTELFSPSTGTWAPAGSLESVHRFVETVALPDGRALIAGGGSDGFRSAEIWDPNAKSWRLTSPMNTGRRQFGLAVLTNGTVLAAGGSLGVGWTTRAEIFDPATESWTPTGDMLHSSDFRGHLIPLLDGRVLVAYAPVTQIYDPSSGVWRQTAVMAQRVDYTSTLLRDGRVLVAGGVPGEPRAAEIFDPVTEAWTRVANMSNGRFKHRAALLPDGRVLVCGGTDSVSYYATYLNSTEIYDPATDTWSPGPNMNLARADFLMTPLDTGILAAGGAYETRCIPFDDCYDYYTADAEIFYP